MQKLVRWWRYSMAIFFFILLVGFCMVKYDYLGGQFFGSEVTYYLGLVMMLGGWLLVEISLGKPKIAKILIPISIGLVGTAAILINGYIALISGIILAGIIALHYLIIIRSNTNLNSDEKGVEENKKVIIEEQKETMVNTSV